jgi:hypothetical protein
VPSFTLLVRWQRRQGDGLEARRKRGAHRRVEPSPHGLREVGDWGIRTRERRRLPVVEIDPELRASSSRISPRPGAPRDPRLVASDRIDINTQCEHSGGKRCSPGVARPPGRPGWRAAPGAARRP